MSREEIQKLLGGYATDTLNEAERSALFEAALEDQELFEALAKEQALRDVLQDPAAREQVIEALAPARNSFAAGAWHWLRRPAVLSVAGGLAVLLLVAALVLRQTKPVARQEAIVADAITPTPPPAVPPSSPLQKVAPPVNGRSLKRLAPLSAGRLRATAEPAAPAPPPAVPLPQATPSGVLGGSAGAAIAAPRAAKSPIMRFSAQDGSRLALSRAKPAAATPPVEYTLLLKGADDVYSTVPTGTVFHAGDSVRIQIEPGQTGYASLFQRDAGDGWRLIESQPVEQAQRYVLPSTGNLQSDVPAQLELLLVFSREKHNTDGDALAADPGGHSFRIALEFR
jgi:hypothetical protein